MRLHLTDLLVLMIVAMSFASVPGTGARSRADLAIEQLVVTPSVDSYSVKVTIANLGNAPSGQTSVVLYDEQDLSTGEEMMIARLTVPSLDPGRRTERSVDWFGATGGAHRLWAVLDPGNRELELDRFNNIASMTMDMPSVVSISSPCDGVPDPGIVGTAMKGLVSEFPLEIRYSGDIAPSMVKANVEIGETGSRYAPTGSDSVSRISVDLGQLEVGDHQVNVNTTISGRRLTDNTTVVRVRGPPDWFAGLGSPRGSFDPIGREYTLIGNLDIPGLAGQQEIEGLNRTTEIAICDGGSDITLTAHVLTDGTTTIEASGSVRVRIGEVSSSVRLEGVSFMASPEGPGEITASGSTEVSIDITDGLVPDYRIIMPPLGGSVPHIDLPTIDGMLTASVVLTIDQGDLRTAVKVGSVLSGYSVQELSAPSIGAISPISRLGTSLIWNKTYELGRSGQWSERGAISGSVEVDHWDLGLSYPAIWNGAKVHGIDLFVNGNGNLTYVDISGDSSSITTVRYFDGEFGSEVRSSNLYKADATGILLDDGRAIVAWTEATSYSEDYGERFSSVRTKVCVQRGQGEGFDVPWTPWSGTSFRPELVRSEGIVYLFHLADPAGPPYSGNDVSLQVMRYDAGNWSPAATVARGPLANGYSIVPDGYGNVLVCYIIGDRAEIARIDPSLTVVKRSGWDLEREWFSFGIGISKEGSPWVVHSTLGAEEGLSRIEAVGIDPQGLEPGAAATVSVSRGVIGQIVLSNGPQGLLQAVWVESLGGNDSIHVSMMSPGPADGDPWLEPLVISSPQGAKRSLTALGRADGTVSLGYQHVPSGSEGPESAFLLPNVSHAARVVQVDHSAGPGYSPGDTTVLYVTLKNMGFLSRSVASVEFVKAYRDPMTGEVTLISIGTKDVEFGTLGAEVLLEHPVMISENQIGIYVMSRGMGGIDHSSERFLPLPAISDLDYSNVEMVDLEDGTVRATITVRNSGPLPSGARTLSLIGTEPTLPVVFPGGAFEASLLRTFSPTGVVNSTTVYIGPYEERTFVLDSPPEPGVRLLTVGLERNPWEDRDLISGETAVQSVLPEMVVEFDRDLYIHSSTDAPSVWVNVTNIGQVSVNDVLALPRFVPPPGPLVPSEPPMNIRIKSLAPDGTQVGSFDIDVSSLGRGEWRMFEAKDILVGSAFVARMGISASWWIGHHVDGGFPTPPPSPESVLTGVGSVTIDHGPVMEMAVGYQEIKVSLNNTSDRHIRSAIVVIYDGRLEDGVVLSSAILEGLAPGTNGSVSMETYLSEGYYLLYAAAFLPTDRGNGHGPDWTLSYETSGEFSVENASGRDGSGNPDPTDKEVRSTLLMAMGMAAMVAVVALVFRGIEESRREKD